MRSVFQEQPEVAHVYLGSKRHMMRRLFSDENEPFWRSAKPVELGVIAPDGRLAQFVHTGMPDDAVERIGHLPQGKGLLGALIDDPCPIRLHRIAEDVPE